MNEMQNVPKRDSSSDAVPPSQISALSKEDFTPIEIARLISARDRFRHGDLNDWTGEYKRLLFARWLYEHSKIAI